MTHIINNVYLHAHGIANVTYFLGMNAPFPPLHIYISTVQFEEVTSKASHANG